MNIITAQKEKAREIGLREIDGSYLPDNFLAFYVSELDEFITNTVHAVLEKVMDGVPEEMDNKVFSTLGWNAYRTVFLKHLDDMKKEI